MPFAAVFFDMVKVGDLTAQSYSLGRRVWKSAHRRVAESRVNTETTSASTIMELSGMALFPIMVGMP
jgi:hypothetical protein